MKNESRISVRTLTAMALLIAMSIVFSRVLSISTGFVRFNLGSLPVLLAGILFGPWAGFVVGMVADIIGGVLAGYAINPLITLGAASRSLRPKYRKRYWHRRFAGGCPGPHRRCLKVCS